MKASARFRVASFIALLALLASRGAAAQATAIEAMDTLIERLYATLTLDELYALDDAKVQQVLTPGERKALATKHWCFDVDAPAVVSVMRNVEQKVPPYWLAEAGFKKTDMTVKNQEKWTYEVWQKTFPAGRVELGINGFDEFRPHYFVCVGPVAQTVQSARRRAFSAGSAQTDSLRHAEPGGKVTLSNFYPSSQTVNEMKPGAFTYHDWNELLLTQVPEALRGQQLLPTTRGRAREACLVESFRKTPYPSAEKPAPVFLTWSDDPRTTQNVQWRTSAAVADGAVRYRAKGATTPFQTMNADCRRMEDRMLANDRYCHWHAAVLRGLEPGTTYEYQAGSPAKDLWAEPAEFTTAPAEPKPFRFFYCSDTHNRKEWGGLLRAAYARHPDAAFCTISGDLVGTGLHRDDWDEELALGEPMFRARPLMPAIGNHDAQLGLGAGMYLDIFGLPENGPKDIPPERAYTFTYGNAQFFVLDVMSDTAPQAAWLREQMPSSTAAWKIAVFHFPLYSVDDPETDVIQTWGPVFDEFHMDLVLTGHVHYHMRTYPMRAGQRAASSAEGTVYITSVSIPGDPVLARKPECAEVLFGGQALCNVIEIDAHRCTFRAETIDGKVKDEFTLTK